MDGTMFSLSMNSVRNRSSSTRQGGPKRRPTSRDSSGFDWRTTIVPVPLPKNCRLNTVTPSSLSCATNHWHMALDAKTIRADVLPLLHLTSCSFSDSEIPSANHAETPARLCTHVKRDVAQVTRLKKISDTTLFGTEDASTRTTAKAEPLPTTPYPHTSARFPLRA